MEFARSEGQRKNITPNQKRMLIECFEQNKLPKKHEIAAIAAKTNLTSRKVMRWFQNKRYMVKMHENNIKKRMKQAADEMSDYSDDLRLDLEKALSSDGGIDGLGQESQIDTEFSAPNLTRQSSLQTIDNQSFLNDFNPYEGLNPEHVLMCRELEMIIALSTTQRPEGNNQINNK